MFKSLADTKNRNPAQVDVVLGIKFVDGGIPEKKVKRKADTEDFVLQGYKLTVTQLVIEIYSIANGVSRTTLNSVYSFIKKSDRDLKFVYLFCPMVTFPFVINWNSSFFFLYVL